MGQPSRNGSNDSAGTASAVPPASPSRNDGRPGHRRGRGGGPRPWPSSGPLQAEYEAWRDQLPESLADSRTAELLEGVCDVDLDALDSRAAAGVRTRLKSRPKK